MKKMKNIFAALLVIPLLNIGCGKWDHGTPLPIAPPPRIQYAKLVDSEFYKIVAGALPNQYSIQLKAPAWATEVRKDHLGSGKTEILKNPNLLDADVVSGARYHYTFQGEAKETQIIVVIVPSDLEITGSKILTEADVQNEGTEFRKSRRIFLRAGADVVIGRLNLEINTEELIVASGAKIRSGFSAAAETGVTGASSGNVSIIAEKASGQLILQLDGQNGGAGATGKTYPERAAQGALWAVLHGWPPGSDKSRDVGNCALNLARAGGPGAAGADGGAGGNGANGGNVGKVEVKVKSANLFSKTILSNPGAGGPGGAGGAGQLGGLGGFGESTHVWKTIVTGKQVIHSLIGERSYTSECTGGKKPLPDGPVGANGKNGAPGLPGAAGLGTFNFAH